MVAARIDIMNTVIRALTISSKVQFDLVMSLL